jgi:pyruvate formate lyase activating enzyme
MGQRSELAPFTVRGEFWHALEDGRVQCDLCPRACRMHEGQKGFCFVREARAGGVALASYGRASGFCLDPIEKKPLNHFYPGSSVLSFGTAGCNLGCKFCQNWDISKARADDRLTERASPDAIARAARAAGAKSVAFTYNDPVIFAEYAIDCAEAAREHGVEPVVVSAGYIGERARAAFFRPMRAANIDLKAFSERFYEKLCFAHLGPVLDTLRYLRCETQVWLEVTTLLIPGQNDSEAEVAQLCEWVAAELGPETPLHFTAFHPDFKLLDAPHTPAATLLRARRQALAIGLKHVYTGNVRDPAGQSTYCAGCGACLIERDGYAIGKFALALGPAANGQDAAAAPDAMRAACPHCGHCLPGHFEARAGQFGPRRIRLPVHEGAS